MPNLNVGYARPNRALATLTAELRAKYGNPARTYEYVTGYKSASNISGHNADSNGVVHSVDIFVGPGNLTEAQGITVAEQLRIEGTKGSIPGHPDRLAYIIHRRRIAGDHTGWAWVAYGGVDAHYDHIHVSSVFDYYWGDPVAGSPLDYDSTAPWGLNTTTSQGGTITPIPQKDGFDMASLADLRTIIKEEVATSSWGYKNPRLEKDDAYALLRATRTYVVKNSADIAGLRAVMEQLAKGQGVAIDYAQVKAAAAAGAAEALAAGVDLDATVTIRGTK